MAVLTRKNIKLFAVNSANNQTGKVGTYKLGSAGVVFSKDPDVIQSGEWENGMVDTLQSDYAPFLEEYNSIIYCMSYFLKQLAQTGIMQYDASEEYYVGSYAISTVDGYLYRSLQGTSGSPNTGHEPSASPTYWQLQDFTDLQSKVDTNLITGLVVSSNLSNTDEDINITTGKALCKDLSTIVSLDTAETGLSMPTLLGSALANSTSYHLFRYKKNDDTDQWHLSTSLTPTIADIKSANAYRRVFSFKTNSTGDIIKFYSIDLGRDLEIKYLENNGIKDLDTNTLPTASRSALTLSCPNNTEALLNVKFLDDDSTSDYVLLTEEVQTDSAASVDVHTISAEDEIINNIYIKMKTNASSQIYYRADGGSVGFLKIYTLGYITRRINS